MGYVFEAIIILDFIEVCLLNFDQCNRIKILNVFAKLMFFLMENQDSSITLSCAKMLVNRVKSLKTYCVRLEQVNIPILAVNTLLTSEVALFFVAQTQQGAGDIHSEFLVNIDMIITHLLQFCQQHIHDLNPLFHRIPKVRYWTEIW